ncbi:zona pellucida sperm-binding protein 3-like isoform X2 [Narcine bancroftii]
MKNISELNEGSKLCHKVTGFHQTISIRATAERKVSVMVSVRSQSPFTFTPKVFVDQLRYSTHLYLVPQDVGSAVEESRVAIASIECHDPRKVNVDWQMGLPRIPLIPLRTKGGLVQSSLRLMNADWTAERTSKIYRWGDFIHVEVSVTISYTPRSVYVDRCEAIPSLVQDFAPRYHLISFNG